MNTIFTKCTKNEPNLVIVVNGVEEKAYCACNKCDKKK